MRLKSYLKTLILTPGVNIRECHLRMAKNGRFGSRCILCLKRRQIGAFYRSVGAIRIRYIMMIG